MASTKLLVGLLGILLTFAPDALYDFYGTTGERWGLSPLDDQDVGRALMALEQSIVMGIALAYLFIRMLAESDREDERAERYEAASPPLSARAEQAADPLGVGLGERAARAVVSRSSASSASEYRSNCAVADSTSGRKSFSLALRAAGVIATSTRRRSPGSERRRASPERSRRSSTVVTAPVLRPLSRARRPAVAPPRRSMMARQRASVRLMPR